MQEAEVSNFELENQKGVEYLPEGPERNHLRWLQLFSLG